MGMDLANRWCFGMIIIRFSFSETHKFGILEVDASGLVTSFLEKPSPESTSSRMAVRSTIIIYYTTVTFDFHCVL